MRISDILVPNSKSDIYNVQPGEFHFQISKFELGIYNV